MLPTSCEKPRVGKLGHRARLCGHEVALQVGQAWSYDAVQAVLLNQRCSLALRDVGMKVDDLNPALLQAAWEGAQPA